MKVEDLPALIRDIPDFPKPGVVFKDITPLLADVDAFRTTIDAIVEHFEGRRIDRVLGIEARGFIAAAPVAYRFGAAFVPVRKAGKLPWDIERVEYELEYGTDLLEIHRDAVNPGDHVADRRRRARDRRHRGRDRAGSCRSSAAPSRASRSSSPSKRSVVERSSMASTS